MGLRLEGSVKVSLLGSKDFHPSCDIFPTSSKTGAKEGRQLASLPVLDILSVHSSSPCELRNNCCAQVAICIFNCLYSREHQYKYPFVESAERVLNIRTKAT